MYTAQRKTPQKRHLNTPTTTAAATTTITTRQIQTQTHAHTHTQAKRPTTTASAMAHRAPATSEPLQIITTKTTTTPRTTTPTTIATQIHTHTRTRGERKKSIACGRARFSASTAANLKCTRRLCMLAFYSTLLAAHATLAIAVGEVKSHTLRTPTTKFTTTPTATPASTPAAYSPPLTATGSFRPIIPADLTPEDISRQVFTPKGQYRVFESAESDLRATSTIRRHDEMPEATPPRTNSISLDQQQQQHQQEPTVAVNEVPTSSDKELEALLAEYVQSFFEKGRIEPLPGLVFALQKNGTHMGIATPVMQHSGEDVDGESEADVLIRHVRDAVTVTSASGGGGARSDDSVISVNIPRALQSGRLLFFSGLKKVLWPVFMGLQVLKSLLFALLLPTIIGSVGKLLGKGIISGSAPLFIRPMDAPQEVDFKDNSVNFDDDNKFAMSDFEGTKDDAYAYNQPEASQHQYVYNAAGLNQQALSRYGNEQQKMQDSYLSALQSIGSASFKNSNSISGSSSGGGLGGALGGGGGAQTAPTRNVKPAAPANVNTFQTFQKVPASSLLLSNYDPFYSPLLSRLDSVFAQLKLNSESEVCREKLICLMYANPAKYAPYSNLVSAQLSRELNELRKPTSDNPDILRFFKYMRAAKDGQDGIECEKTFSSCDEFKDFENPAMVSTYNDINKLVQARKFT